MSSRAAAEHVGCISVSALTIWDPSPPIEFLFYAPTVMWSSRNMLDVGPVLPVESQQQEGARRRQTHKESGSCLRSSCRAHRPRANIWKRHQETSGTGSVECGEFSSQRWSPPEQLPGCSAGCTVGLRLVISWWNTNTVKVAAQWSRTTSTLTGF